MNFTREPIIETIITPKEGFKLVIRNSHGTTQEEFSVCSVEVVSFGSSLFFRSLEKPKPFLLPVSDYEVLEARETRTVLKKAIIDKSIKIGGGKAPPKPKEAFQHEEEEPSEAPGGKHEQGRRSSRRRRPEAKREEAPAPQANQQAKEPIEQPVIRRTLLPPPTSLISEQISRYKEYLTAEGAILPEEKKSEDLNLVPEGKESDQEEEKVVDINEAAHTSPETDENS